MPTVLLEIGEGHATEPAITVPMRALTTEAAIAMGAEVTAQVPIQVTERPIVAVAEAASASAIVLFLRAQTLAAARAAAPLAGLPPAAAARVKAVPEAPRA